LPWGTDWDDDGSSARLVNALESKKLIQPLIFGLIIHSIDQLLTQMLVSLRPLGRGLAEPFRLQRGTFVAGGTQD
jgi:hypothetical protein